MAQVSTVPMGDPVYQDIDRVLATGLVENGYSSQRPYTRREIARMLVSVQRKPYERQLNAVTLRIIERLRARFAPEIRMLAGQDAPEAREAVYRWRAEALGLSSPPRGIPEDFTGTVAASINPLLNDRSGRQYGEGGNLAAELEFERALLRRLSVRVRPRLLTGANAGETNAFGSLQNASVSLKVRNIITEVGRHDVIFAQGMESGFMSSTSARPLDMVRFTTDAPFRLPILSRVFGAGRGNLVIADLGPRQHFPNSTLIAYKLASFPTQRFELAATVLAVQGGRGAPTTSLWEHVKDLIPALKYLLEDDVTQFSNKMAGWEYRLRIPELRGMQIYAEHAFEDMDPRRWGSTFWEDGGIIFGTSLQNLAGDGALSGTFEFHHTGLRFYQHTIFRTGMAFNGTLLGNPLGNDANGAYLRLRWDEGRQNALTIDAAVERRDGDLYRTQSDPPNDDNFRFERLENNPAEWRERVVTSWMRDDPRGGRRTTLQLGLERVQNFAFAGGRTRTNFLIGATVDAYRR
jgi:hypothetical protein